MSTGLLRQKTEELRASRNRLIDQYGMVDLQQRSLAAISELAAQWLKFEGTAPSSNEPFPPDHVWHSLVPLLRSLNEDNLHGLLESEGVVVTDGPQLIGHVIASNTPLLGITSVIRALLTNASSIVKLPSGIQCGWFAWFCDLLMEIDPQVGGLIDGYSWHRSDVDITQAFCRSVDLLIVYGDDKTIAQFRILGDQIPLIEYGHRMSIAVLLRGADFMSAAEGLAADVLLYNQGGCLSPQCVLVEGSSLDARRFALALNESLMNSKLSHFQSTLENSWEMEQYRLLASMDKDLELVSPAGSRCIVVAHTVGRWYFSYVRPVIHVVPCTKEGIIESIRKHTDILQGVAVASDDPVENNDFRETLTICGASYVCAPGEMQQPTINWRENNQDVLASLVRRISHESG